MRAPPPPTQRQGRAAGVKWPRRRPSGRPRLSLVGHRRCHHTFQQCLTRPVEDLRMVTRGSPGKSQHYAPALHGLHAGIRKRPMSAAPSARESEGGDRVADAELRFPLYERAQEAGVLDGGSALIVAPTGTGKSFIGRQAIVRALQRGTPGTHAYLVPFRALADEVYTAFSELLESAEVPGPASPRLPPTRSAATATGYAMFAGSSRPSFRRSASAVFSTTWWRNWPGRQ